MTRLLHFQQSPQRTHRLRNFPPILPDHLLDCPPHCFFTGVAGFPFSHPHPPAHPAQLTRQHCPLLFVLVVLAEEVSQFLEVGVEVGFAELLGGVAGGLVEVVFDLEGVFEGLVVEGVLFVA